MPCDYSKYPKNWKSYIRPEILKRAGNACEQCGVPNYAMGYRDDKGTFVALSRVQQHRLEKSNPHGHKVIKIVLTVAHMDHDVKNNDMMEHGANALPRMASNLRALCQKCHLAYDAEHHQANAANTRRKNKVDAGQLELELGV